MAKPKKSKVKKIKIVDSDEHLGKTIDIKCSGSDLIEIDQLTNFQGKLKTLSDESYEKLKASILELGFSFPVAAWQFRNKKYILDAHQRVSVLKKMRDEGYFIPKIPVVWIEAADKKQAAKKLLAATSQYGEVTTDGLKEFLTEYKLTIDEVLSSFVFPEIDLLDFKESFLDSLTDEGSDSGKVDYSKKIQPPIYTPTRDDKPNLKELYDCNKANDLIEKIKRSHLPDEEKLFLTFAAYRHIIFNYENIAEYYAHSKKSLQELMEDSALVIIDFNSAIENGFAVLSENIAASYEENKNE